MTIDIDKFISGLNINQWFIKTGRSFLPNTNKVSHINSLENGVLVWINNIETRSQRFNMLNFNLQDNEDWVNNKQNIINLLTIEFKKNTKFMQFIRDLKLLYTKHELLKKDYNLKNKISVEFVISQLPIIGYFGETLLNNKKFQFYTNEVEYFKKGVFVIEHTNDNKFLIY